VVKSQAEVLDTVTGVDHVEQCNPFHRSRKTLRSPDKERSHSLDNNSGFKVIRQQTGIKSSLQDRKEESEQGKLIKEESKITILEMQLKEARKEIRELKEIINSFKSPELRVKNASNKQVKDNENQSGASKPREAQEYYTDEDDLARETDWIVKEKRPLKKRKAESSPEEVKHETNEDVKKNRETRKGRTKGELPPPPINVVDITDYSSLRNLLVTGTDKDYKVTSLNNNVWKVNAPDSESYRALTRKLDDTGIQWYTYENKNERPIRVMVRGLQASCSNEDIQENLKQRGYKILDAVNFIKKEKKDVNGEQTITKRGLPLFMLSFDNKESIEKIYQIRNILNIVCKIEPLRNNTKLIPQCKRCQGFNHTQTYCRKEPRCVKCAGKHLTKNCSMNRQMEPKCINCKEAHPANYRGCVVAKELQKRRNAILKPQLQKRRQIQTRNKEDKSEREGNNFPKTFAQAIADNPKKEQESPITETLALILNKIDEQNNINKMISNRLEELEQNVRKISASKSKSKNKNN